MLARVSDLPKEHRNIPREHKVQNAPARASKNILSPCGCFLDVSEDYRSWRELGGRQEQKPTAGAGGGGYMSISEKASSLAIYLCELPAACPDIGWVDSVH